MDDPRRQVFTVFTSTPGHSRRAVSWATQQPGWVARAAATVVVLLLAALAILLIVPALIIGAIVFVLLSVYVAVRVRIARWRSDRSRAEGRENVRVIRRDEPRS